MAWRKEDAYRDPVEPGEVPGIRVLVVVSPGWGKLRRGRLEQGSGVDHGTVICALHEQGSETIVTAPGPGVFLSWMASDGERVAPGTPIAQLGPASAGT